MKGLAALLALVAVLGAGLWLALGEHGARGRAEKESALAPVAEQGADGASIASELATPPKDDAHSNERAAVDPVASPARDNASGCARIMGKLRLSDGVSPESEARVRLVEYD